MPDSFRVLGVQASYDSVESPRLLNQQNAQLLLDEESRQGCRRPTGVMGIQLDTPTESQCPGVVPESEPEPPP